MLFRGARPPHAVSGAVTVQTRGYNVGGGIFAAFRANVQMLRGAFERRQRPTLRSERWRGGIPHGQSAIVTAASLSDHFLSADIGELWHVKDTPFDFVRSECATSIGTLPGWKLLLARDPIFVVPQAGQRNLRHKAQTERAS